MITNVHVRYGEISKQFTSDQLDLAVLPTPAMVMTRVAHAMGVDEQLLVAASSVVFEGNTALVRPVVPYG